MTETSPYTAEFFRANARSAMRSAAPVLQIVVDLYRPTSIIDIGCGSGGWLAAAEQLGFDVVKGIDGPWADPATYTSATIDFEAVDLEQSDYHHDRRYDLAMSVEVAEHLSAARADFIVDLLCGASDVVLFGAATPNQGGTHHINEVPQTSWIEKFRARGYEPYDVIRPNIWDNDAIQWWFRQNTLLYVKTGSEVIDVEKLHALEHRLWDVVHPQSLDLKLARLRKKVREQQLAARDLRAQRDRARGNREKAQRQLDEARRELATLRAQLEATKKRSFAPRSMSKKDIPEAIRPTVLRAWRALPESVRSTVRPKRPAR